MDEKYLVDLLVRLLKVPTQIPLGTETLIAADHPVLVHYIEEFIRPELIRIGAYEIIEAPLNQVVVRMGKGTSDRTLLIQVYTPTQHSNLMQDPFSGKIAIPKDSRFNEPCAFGQGASQNKAHMAAMLTVLKRLMDDKIDLSGTLYLAVNNEGRSSHHCTDAILSILDPKPTAAILAIGTDMDIILGNRGRVDIYINVVGKAGHSSNPDACLSAIEGAHQVMKRLEALDPKETHPLLGRQRLIVYQIVYAPLAPHTLPGTAKITIDRRILPGEDPDKAVDEVKQVLKDMAPYEVTVDKGVMMLPALTSPDSPIVLDLQMAARRVLGSECRTRYPFSTFDLGGLTSRGIPAAMFGTSGGSGGILGEDFVSIRETVEEAEILFHVITKMLE